MSVPAAVTTTSTTSATIAGPAPALAPTSASITTSTPTAASASAATALRISYISAAVAASLDAELMDPDRGAFSLDQLMELAGLACAQAVFRSYPPDQAPNVLVACGPGNQGGDGLVAARHLLHFGYTPRVWYPKRGKTELFGRLVRQLLNLDIEFVDPEDFEDALENADVVLDAIFGFSFKGEVRQPFREPLELLKDESRMEFESRTKLPPIVSVDIPSAWDVDEGNINNRSFTPQVLISLTAPKLGSRAFNGRHFLGGRFLPPAVAERYGVLLPPVFLGAGAVGAGQSSVGQPSQPASSSNDEGGSGGAGTVGSGGRVRRDPSASLGSDSRTPTGTDGKGKAEPASPSTAALSTTAAASGASSSSSSATPLAASAAAESSQQQQQASSAYGSSASYTSFGPNALAFDDSQIIEITGAEIVPLLEPAQVEDEDEAMGEDEGGFGPAAASQAVEGAAADATAQIEGGKASAGGVVEGQQPAVPPSG